MTKRIIFFPEPTARSAVRRGLLIPLGYLHPGKCEHSEVQSHPPCHGRTTFFVVMRMRESSQISKYGGLHEEQGAYKIGR